MSKELTLAQKVRNIKIGEPFTVATEKDRQRVLRVAKSLKDAGFIDFDIVTKRCEEGFKVAAI